MNVRIQLAVRRLASPGLRSGIRCQKAGRTVGTVKSLRMERGLADASLVGVHGFSISPACFDAAVPPPSILAISVFLAVPLISAISVNVLPFDTDFSTL